MALFYELEKGCCGCSVRSTVYIALFHYMVHGVFIVLFVFTNSCYPPFYYTDYLLGGTGAALFLLSLFATFIGSLENLQWLRSMFGFLLMLIVGCMVVSTYMYALERWNDVISTALTRSFRKPVEWDFPDYFWYTLVTSSCIFCFLFLLYLVYVVSFFCNKYQPPLLSEIYQTGVISSTGSRVVTLPPDTYSTKTYKPYPVQAYENPK